MCQCFESTNSLAYFREKELLPNVFFKCMLVLFLAFFACSTLLEDFGHRQKEQNIILLHRKQALNKRNIGVLKSVCPLL